MAVRFDRRAFSAGVKKCQNLSAARPKRRKKRGQDRSNIKDRTEMAARDDKTMAGLLRRGLSGTEAAPAGCPDPDLLAAYYDRVLEPAEVAHWETHFSTCAHCRAQLAVLARSEAQEARTTRPAWLGSLWWLAPAAPVLAVVLLVVMARSPRIFPKEVALSGQPAATTTASAPNPPSEPLVAKNAEAPTPEAPPKKEARASRATPATSRLSGERKRPAGAGAAAALAQNAAGGPEKAEKETGENHVAANEDQDKPAIAGREAAGALAGRRVLAPVAPSPPAASGAAAPVVSQQTTQTTAMMSRAQISAAGREERKAAGTFAAKAVESRASAVMVLTPDPAVVWRVGPAGSIERSEDAGQTWRGEFTKVNADLTAGSAPSRRVCWVVGRGGTILRTNDGKHWRQVSSPVAADFVSIKARDKRHATVATADGRIFSTVNGGRTWQPRP
jgi:hypothetical protein